MTSVPVRLLWRCGLLAALAVLPRVAPAAPAFPEPAGEDAAGFVPLFDGRTLTGWDADPRYWRVENGVLVGEVTPDRLLKANSFAIWRGGAPADFELKAEYRISASGNIAVNYRSVEIAAPKFALKGYQCDLDGALRWTGQNYEERGRTFLALRGQVTRLAPGAKPAIVADVGSAAPLGALLKTGDWNQVHLIVRGNVLVHLINGHVMSVVVDEDPAQRTRQGLIGVQVHVGPPMKVEFRNLLLKTLPPVPAPPPAPAN